MRPSRTLPLLAAATLAAHAHAQATTGPGTAAARPEARVQRERDTRGRVNGPTREGWWNDAAFYEVFVRSFQDSSAGPLAGDGVGDIRGLISRLDSLNDGDPATTTDLGVTGLWLMPVSPSPSYHGYDVTDYRGIEPKYGTLEDFRALTGACHARGIRVILDLVLNHCSDRHPWFAEAVDPASPRHDWFTWSATDPGWRGPWGQRVWRRASGAGGPWYYGLFTAHMPDLNFRTPAVGAEMLAVADYWVGREHGLGADGFRLDAVRHLIENGQTQENTSETHAWLRTFQSRLKKSNPDAMTIGEVWADSPTAASYVGRTGPGADRDPGAGNELDMTFAFDLGAAMVQSARTGAAGPIMAAQRLALESFPPNQYGRFLTNHDQTRVLTLLKGDAGAMRAAAAMLLLGPGVPFIYYGEEVGMTGDKPDENLRTPMQWTPEEGAGFTTGAPWQAIHADRASANVRDQSDDEKSLLSWYRRLIRLRAGSLALRCGGFEEVESGHPGVYAFVRTDEACKDASDARPVLVLINLTARPVRDYAIRLPSSESVVCPPRPWAMRESLHDAPVREDDGRPIQTLAPHEAYVLEIRPLPR